MHEVLDPKRADQVLRAAYPDERQRDYAMRWLGWLAFHMGADERLDWWAIPAWMPPAQLVTARRLAAWAVLTAAAGLAIAATVWAAILFGIVGWIAAVQAVFGDDGGRSTPLVLHPGEPRVVVPRGLRWREAGRLAASAVPLVVTAAPFLVRLWAIPAASRSAASAARTYRADRMTSLIMAVAWTPFGALLAAIPLLPAYGSAGWLAAVALFAAGTGAFAGLMTGRYPLLKLTEFILAARCRERVSFKRLLEDAADRRVLLRADGGYEFADEAVRARLAALGQAALAGQARQRARRSSRAGIGARLAGLSDGAITRVCIDLTIGACLFLPVWMALTEESVHDPLSLLVFLSVFGGAIIVIVVLPRAKDLLRWIVGGARWRQANLAGLSGLRGLIVGAVTAGTAWLLVANAGPALARAVAAVLPTAFVAACGTWACLLAFRKTSTTSGRWRRKIPDALAVATTTAAILVRGMPNLLTAQPAAGLLFPPAIWGAVLLWRAMNGSDRLALKAGADIVLSVLLGAELVLMLVWLANVVGLPRAEMAAVRDAADRAGSFADLPWQVWTGLYVLLAAAGLAFVRWPGRLAKPIRWSGRLRVVPSVEVARRSLTVVHISLLVIVLAGLAAPAVLAPTFQRQLRSAYIVALQRKLEAEGELAAYAEIRGQFTDATAQPVLAEIVAEIDDISSPAPGDDDATSTETDLARRVGELQALALGLAPPPALLASEQAAATEAGFGEPARGASGLSDRIETVQKEETEDDAAAKRAEQAGDLAAAAVASTISIPHISANEIFQIVREYLSGLIEGSPLKDTFAAWAERLAGAEAPPDASQAVAPDPEKLEQAAANELSDEISAEGLQNPIGNPALASVQDESPVDAAVDLTNQARYLQENSGPCVGCVRPPANPEDNPVDPPDDHVDEP